MGPAGIKILFVAGFGPIVRDSKQSRKLYSDTMGIVFKEEKGGYLHTEYLPGAKTFALWPLMHAALSCFGVEYWPDGLTIPQAWIEFDVDDVELATSFLESKGQRFVVRNKTEPWGQIVSRFISPEGLLVGLTFTPAMREKK